jgi:aminobenzoyl-glutamate transport protein
MDTRAENKGKLNQFLNMVERVCNKLPPPAILFILLFIITAILGAVLTQSGVALENPATHKMVYSQNFFTKAGIQWLLTSMVKNFTGFAPLGLVITMTLAIGFCEESGLLVSLLNRSMKNVPPNLVPYFVAFAGTIGNIASDTAAVVIPPLGAIVFLGVGKNPIAGMICGYAGANVGFTANLLIAGTDSLLQGLTNQAIEGFLGNSSFVVDVTCNWYFMVASTFLCSLVIGYSVIKIVEPRLGKYEGETLDTVQETTELEKKGMRNAGFALLVMIVLIAVGFFTGVLSKDGHTLVGSLLLKGLIPILFFALSLVGVVYGCTVGTFKNMKDVNKAMVKQMSAMGAYIVFCFFCGQFQALFKWTHMGTLISIEGANFLKSVGFTGLPMCIVFVLITACINLFMSSGSAKWAILAPIFVPMFMLLGYHPGFTQLLYRLGDSPTNAVTPMMPYLWMCLSVAQEKYMPDCTLGMLISNLLPVALIMQVIWIIFMVIWVLAGIPIGPGVGVTLPAGVL